MLKEWGQFRAKRVDNGERVQGWLWQKKYNTDKYMIKCFPDEDDGDEDYVVDKRTLEPVAVKVIREGLVSYCPNCNANITGHDYDYCFCPKEKCGIMLDWSGENE